MKKIYITATIVLLSAMVHAQALNDHDPDGSVRSSVISMAHATFGNDYIVTGYEVLDSMLVKDSTKEYSYNNFTDPYSTLEHCIIFWAKPPHPDTIGYDDEDWIDTTVVCIARNGSIIWNSGNHVRAIKLRLEFCYDLNKDGKVDVGLATINPFQENFSRLYILSWDGNSGTFINAVDSTNQSALVSSTYAMFAVFDYDGDGIYEIRSRFPDSDDEGSGWFPNNPSSTAPFITYVWNGSVYGYSASVPQIAGETFLPTNRLTLRVRCNVVLEDNKYKYTYVFKSDSTSKQLVDYIYIDHIDTSDVIPYHPWGGDFTWIQNGYYWGSDALKDRYRIRAGEEISGAGLLSAELPSIKNIYAKSYEEAYSDAFSDTVTEDQFEEDILTNSYHTYTVGPAPLPSPFVPLNFLDTLSSYTTQSRSLGWITNQSTADKYAALFDSARSQLTRGASRSVRTTLDTVLANAQRDSGTVLSSEAYALIFFNTQYLLGQMPTLPSQFELNLNINGSGTVGKSPDLTLYDSATVVTVTATPSSGYAFVSWSDSLTGISNPAQLVMNSNKKVMAVFKAVH